jgi:hypothetical protein
VSQTHFLGKNERQHRTNGETVKSTSVSASSGRTKTRPSRKTHAVFANAHDAVGDKIAQPLDIAR